MVGAVSLSALDLRTQGLFNFFSIFALWSFPSFGKNSSFLLCKRVLYREKLFVPITARTKLRYFNSFRGKPAIIKFD